jgi:hypothetical protein
MSSRDPVLARGALQAAKEVLSLDDRRKLFSDAVRAEAKATFLRAAESIVLTGDSQSVVDVAALLGGLHDDASHELLWNFASRKVAYEETLIAITWFKDPSDLPRLASLLNAPVKDDAKSRDLASLPGALLRAYGKEALPVLEDAVVNSGYAFVRTGCARELVQQNRPAGFAFLIDAIEQKRFYKPEMMTFLRQQFPELKNADDEGTLAFLRQRL